MTVRLLTALVLTAVSITGLVSQASARASWDTSPVVVHRRPHPAPHVVDMRWGQHNRFDRVVVDLDGKIPGYRVRYVHRLTYDPSGNRVPLRGRRYIQIALEPARAHDRHGDSTYHGPKLRQLHLPTLRGVAFLGDFEGVVTLGISLDHRADFRVLALRAPSRIVIDLRH